MKNGAYQLVDGSLCYMLEGERMVTVSRGERRVGVVILREGRQVPEKSGVWSAGWDLFAPEAVTIPKGGFVVVPMGIALNMPLEWEAQVRGRSGLAAKFGVFVLNGPGTIDGDYRGEVKMILANMGREDFQVEEGDRIGQLVFAEVLGVEMRREEAVVIGEGERGTEGCGSTGR